MIHTGSLRTAHECEQLILFVGAGVSQSLGLPPWSEFIDHMARQLGYEPKEYRQYGSALALAEFFRLQHGNIGPLRSWMDRQWHTPDMSVADSRVHELIVRGNFKLIYTTNYDRWLELAFEYYRREFVKVVSVADLARIRRDVTQIVKFHGDFDNDDPIVLDETSYFQRLDFESPLDIKLRADVLGRSVLFIGYSLADINIRYLFYKLSRIWKAAVPGVPQPPSYIFLPVRNPVQQAMLAQWGIGTISPDGEENPSSALASFLEALVGG